MLLPDDNHNHLKNSLAFSFIGVIYLNFTETMASPTTSPSHTPYNEPQPAEQLEVILGVAVVVAVIIVGLGLLIYLIKRK